MIRITKLEEKNLKQAKNLVNKIFPGEQAGKMLYASLYPKKYKEFLNENGILWAEYYVAIDENDNVIGTGGLYTERKDNIVWLGWFCVDKKWRHQKIGTQILNYCIKEATLKGYTTMKIYSSAKEDGKAAAILYEKAGFTKTEEDEDFIYWEKQLTK